MKDLLENFSPEISSELIGEEIRETRSKTFSNNIEKVFDLHGYFESEISDKILFILDFCYSHHLSHIKIVTGKGKQILFSEVLRNLKSLKKEEKIAHYTFDEGSFEVFVYKNSTQE